MTLISTEPGSGVRGSREGGSGRPCVNDMDCQKCNTCMSYKVAAASFPSQVSFKNFSCGCLGGSVSWTSNFGSGHDLTVCESETCIRLTAVSMELSTDPLSSSLFAPPLLIFSLSKINKTLKKKNTFLVILRHHTGKTTLGTSGWLSWWSLWILILGSWVQTPC